MMGGRLEGFAGGREGDDDCRRQAGEETGDDKMVMEDLGSEALGTLDGVGKSGLLSANDVEESVEVVENRGVVFGDGQRGVEVENAVEPTGGNVNELARALDEFDEVGN